MNTMALTLDHIVILVADLERAITDYTALGFTVQRGGTHADGNTHNALVGFADGSYLELIAFLQPAPRHRWAKFAAAGRQGFVDYALLPHDVGAVIAAARERGLHYGGPQDGGRVRPDGARLQWQIGTPPSPDLPFLCGDITPRALRVREGDVRVHANGVTGVAAIAVAVADQQASAARYRALLGTAEPLGLGTTALRLVAPAPEGEGVSRVTLRSALVAAPRALPPELTSGAVFEIVPFLNP
jgi:catechol 2,3-dioxygenase-like lactoylglutathione lyase family enzyme